MNGKSMIILSILYRCGTSSNEVLVTHSFSLGNQSIISPNSKICTRRKYDTNSNKTYFNDLQPISSTNLPSIKYIQTLPDKATFRPIKRIKLFNVQHILKFDTLLFILLFILLFNCTEWWNKELFTYQKKGSLEA